MKDRPLLLNGPMVRAILAGRKTQTRRPMVDVNGEAPPADARFREMHLSVPAACFDTNAFGPGMQWSARCPFGAPGGRLWVRETFRPVIYGWDNSVEYAADGGSRSGLDLSMFTFNKMALRFSGARPERHSEAWHPSIHMPRWASRLTLEVTGVRVERVRDITEADAQAEGIQQDDEDEWLGGESKDGGVIVCSTARGAFAHLWESVYGLGSWGRNGWVWVVEFRKIDQPAQSA